MRILAFMFMQRGLGVALWCLALLWAAEVSGQTVFYTTLGDSACYDEAYGVYPTDSGYIVSLAHNCLGPQSWEAEMVFLNTQGDSVGSVTSPAYNGFIRPTTDGKLLFLGGTKAGLTYDTTRIAKTELNGDAIWTYDVFFPQCRNQVYDAVNTQDGGYAITGIYSTETCGSVARFNGFVLKLNSNGQELWRETYGGPLDDQLHALQELPNGNLLAYGWSTNVDDNSTDEWLLHVSPTGDSITSQYFGTPNFNDFGYGLDVTYDGNYLTISYLDSVYIALQNPAGSIIFKRGIGIPSGGRYFQAMETKDFHFVFLACFDSPTGCESHLIKTDRDGNIIWDKTWGGLMRRVDEPVPGRFILSGYKPQFPTPTTAQVVVFDTTLLPFDTTTVAALPLPGTQIKIYPNPAKDLVVIEIRSEVITQLTVTDQLGRVVQRMEGNNTSSQSMDTSGLPAGLYIMGITLSGSRQVVYRRLLVY